MSNDVKYFVLLYTLSFLKRQHCLCKFNVTTMPNFTLANEPLLKAFDTDNQWLSAWNDMGFYAENLGHVTD